MFASFFHVPHRLVLYAQRSSQDLLILRLLLVIIIERAFHFFLNQNSGARYKEKLEMQEFFKTF